MYSKASIITEFLQERIAFYQNKVVILEETLEELEQVLKIAALEEIIQQPEQPQ